jgi:hypothetical protein
VGRDRDLVNDTVFEIVGTCDSDADADAESAETDTSSESVPKLADALAECDNVWLITDAVNSGEKDAESSECVSDDVGSCV